MELMVSFSALIQLLFVFSQNCVPTKITCFIRSYQPGIRSYQSGMAISVLAIGSGTLQPQFLC